MSRYALLGSSLLAITLAGTAQAQDQAAEADDYGIREIVVTAQKRADSIQDVPVAVSALDARALEQSAIDDLRDFAGRVPSLVVDPVNAGPSAAAISIRGISFEDIEKSFDPSVGVVVDGVFIGTNTGQLLDAFDLESIEVLRGPQGTLFGRNTIGGVINVRRSRPTGEFGAKASLGYAEFDTWRGRLVVNTPKIGDFLSLKGFFFYDDTGGYLDNVTQGNKQNDYRVWTAGVTALIEPSENIDILVTYEHMDEAGETATASVSRTGTDLICLQVPVPGLGLIRAFGVPDEECDRPASGKALYTIFQNIATPVDNKTDAISAEVTVGLGDFTLTSVTGWRKNDESVRQDFDSVSINFFDTLRIQEYEQFSQELRFEGDVTPWLNLLVGGYYFDSDYVLEQTSFFGFLGPGASAFQLSNGKAKSYAAFGDVRIRATDRLTIGLGGRYTEDKKSLSTNFALSPDGSCPIGFAGITAADCEDSAKFNEFTWRASVDYQIGGDQLVYASYSKGFRSGGFNGRAATPTAIGPYQPETVDAYEVGLKGDWLDRRLRTNIAAFLTNYSDKQEETVRATLPPFNAIQAQETIVENAASARIKGIEFELTAVPTDSLNVFASASYLDANYRSFERSGLDVSDLDLRRAPKWSFSVGMDYSRELGSGRFDWSTMLRFVDDYTTCISTDPILIGQGIVTNDRRCRSEAREILDSTVSYTVDFGGPEVKFSLFGRNLLDDRGLSSTLPVAGLFTFSGVRPPRQFGGEIAIKF